MVSGVLAEFRVAALCFIVCGVFYMSGVLYVLCDQVVYLIDCVDQARWYASERQCWRVELRELHTSDV